MSIPFATTVDFCIRMKTIVVLLLVAPFCSIYINADDFNALSYNLRDGPTLFSKFVKKFGKKYEGQEDYHNHYMNFMKTLRTINEINSQPGSQKVRPNRNADLGVEATGGTYHFGKIDPELKIAFTNINKPSVDSLFKLD